MVFTAILSKLFVRKRLYAHHWFAMLTVAVGLTIVSVIASEEKGDAETVSTPEWFYIFLLLLSQLCMAVQYVMEARFLEEYAIDPLYLVGI